MAFWRLFVRISICHQIPNNPYVISEHQTFFVYICCCKFLFGTVSLWHLISFFLLFGWYWCYCWIAVKLLIHCINWIHFHYDAFFIYIIFFFCDVKINQCHLRYFFLFTFYFHYFQNYLNGGVGEFVTEQNPTLIGSTLKNIFLLCFLVKF